MSMRADGGPPCEQANIVQAAERRRLAFAEGVDHLGDEGQSRRGWRRRRCIGSSWRASSLPSEQAA